MIFCAAKFYNGIPPVHEIELAVLRNFSGLENHDTWAVFKRKLQNSSLAKVSIYSTMGNFLFYRSWILTKTP